MSDAPRPGMWSRLRAAVARHPVRSYFLLTFAVSWGGLLAIVGPRGIVGSKADFERLWPVGIAVVALGPTAASLALTALLDGARGLRALGRSLTRWRVPAGWYALAVLLAPSYFVAAAFALSAVSPAFVPGIVTSPDPVARLISGLIAAIVAGLVEEVGWTGFAVPRLRRRHDAFTTGMIVGALWGAWHVLPKLWGSAAHGLLAFVPQDMACAVVGLTGYRILMVWVFDRTSSLLVAVLMHVGLTAATLVATPIVSGGQLMTFSYATAAVPWLLVALGMSRRRGGIRHEGGGNEP